jgi:hypothetical protein
LDEDTAAEIGPANRYTLSQLPDHYCHT